MKKIPFWWLHDLWPDEPPKTVLPRKVLRRKNKRRQMQKASRRKNR